MVRADGIAINAGTDIAIESADIVLKRSDLNDAVFAVKLGATIKNIKQNLFWAFFTIHWAYLGSWSVLSLLWT